ncbi:MAG: PAS domain S-box protein [Archangium sp.]|nr:PAS domain S-box protein [Archangium sp.]MDP3569677.1 PAS domain S-box protein [Archangium sp.]
MHQIELELQNDELRRTQVELDMARARYFDLYDLAPVGYCTLDETGLIIEANLIAVTMLGMTRQQIMNRAFFRFVVQEDQGALHALFKRVQETGGRRAAEVRLVRSDGGQFWAHLVVSMHVTEGGPERRVVISDVSARKTAEEERREGDARYQDLFSRASDGIIVCALNGTVIEANESFARLHKTRPPALSGTNLAALDTRMVGLSRENATRMERGDVLTFEVEHRDLMGQPVFLEASLSRVLVGGLPRVLGFYRDISERKRLHAGLAQTDRLSSMGLLAAGVAHEINNPLAYVLSNLESVIQDLPGARTDPALFTELTERVSAAFEGAGRIKTISRSLGAFSRVERTELQSVDVNQALERAAAMAKNEIKYRAKLITQFGAVPRVQASEGRLTQVFLNLIMNAAQAIPEGHVAENTITLSTWATATDVFAEVWDTGQGMSAQTLAHIFEPFFTTKAVGAGSGLGLSICKTIMGELGGDLVARSTPGLGTRFVVRLSSLQTAPLVPPAAPLMVAREEAAVAGGRILVVDDEPAIRRMLQRLLGRDHQVVTAASGLEARRLLENDPNFDLILCDLMMPEMTGMELHAWLAARAPDLARKMVFVSGGAFTPNAQAYLEKLDNFELAKPFEPAELLQLVALVLGGGANA